MAESVSRRPATLQVCVLSAASPSVIYGRQSGTWTVFSPSTQTYVSGLLFLGSREYEYKESKSGGNMELQQRNKAPFDLVSDYRK